jgi:hypothetical protein
MFHLRVPYVYQTTDKVTPPAGCQPRVPFVGEVMYRDVPWCGGAAPAP